MLIVEMSSENGTMLLDYKTEHNLTKHSHRPVTVSC